MNERIKEIARRSGATDQNGSMATTVFCFTEMELDNFAELIVRECANIVQDSPWQLPQGYKSVDQAKLVKKYFGVEE
jgi:hypothetical protein